MCSHNALKYAKEVGIYVGYLEAEMLANAIES
jgi:hypothetical protein